MVELEREEKKTAGKKKREMWESDSEWVKIVGRKGKKERNRF